MKRLTHLSVLTTGVLSASLLETENIYNPRLLFETIITSNKCKSCIDDVETTKFCPNSSNTNGYCCLNAEVCPKYQFCSDDFRTPDI